MLASVVAASIVIRLRRDRGDPALLLPAGERPERVVSTGFASLLLDVDDRAPRSRSPFAAPISEALLDQPDAGLARLAILGLWTLTLWEYALTLLRLDERARAYFTITVVNVLVTIPVTVSLVVVEDLGAEGILLGTFGTGALFLAWPAVGASAAASASPSTGPLLRRMLRFGLPTMPAELTLYSLNFIDRIIIVRLAGLAEAGLYALAIKFANGMQVLARGFQLAFPPLAYSIRDDDEARRAYALIVTWFAAVCAFARRRAVAARPAGSSRCSPRRSSSRPTRRSARWPPAIALYALYLVHGRDPRAHRAHRVQLPGDGRRGRRQRRPQPGRWSRRTGSSAPGSRWRPPTSSWSVLMYALTQRLFPVPYEWGRLSLLVGVTAFLVFSGEVLLPEDGIEAWATRTAAWLLIPLVLAGLGFLTPEERRSVRSMLSVRAVRERMRALGSAEDESAPDDRRLPPEVYEQALRDEDRI